jgi:hypothetical protein
MTASASDGASSCNSIIKRHASEMSTTATTIRLDAPPPPRRQRGTLSTLLSRKSPFSNETGSLPVGEFEPSSDGARSSLRDARILVVGAGGLGCEILKDLAMCDGVFRDVVVMDLGEKSGWIRFVRGSLWPYS